MTRKSFAIIVLGVMFAAAAGWAGKTVVILWPAYRQTLRNQDEGSGTRVVDPTGKALAPWTDAKGVIFEGSTTDPSKTLVIDTAGVQWVNAAVPDADRVMTWDRNGTTLTVGDNWPADVRLCAGEGCITLGELRGR